MPRSGVIRERWGSRGLRRLVRVCCDRWDRRRGAVESN